MSRKIDIDKPIHKKGTPVEVEILKERILKDGRVLGHNILKVDSFLNHQIDAVLLNEIGKAFKELYQDVEITKILTAEVSGIAIAIIAAQYFNVPVLYAKKSESFNLDRETYEGNVYSYTKQKHFRIRVSKQYLQSVDKVLILDDFLANGEAIKGLKQIVDSAGATLAGVGVVIEKRYQPGREMLKGLGIDVKALVSITSMDDGCIEFYDEDGN